MVHDSDELVDAELEHSEDDSRLESVVSAHLVEVLAADLEALEHGVVDLTAFTGHCGRLIVDKLH